MRCARHLSFIQDELIRTLFDYVARDVFPAPEQERRRLVIAAVGGYGRGTLAPGSDIDLLFLLPSKNDGWALRVTEAMLYTLWDLRLKVGHSTRSIDDCLRYAREDITIRTALLEARLILGDPDLFADMRNRFDQEVVRQHAGGVRRGEARGTRRPHLEGGRSRYLVEPNVKDSKGGAARSQHALLDRQIRLPRPRRVGTGSGRLILSQGVPPLLPLRGVPVAGEVPPTFRDGARRGTV